MGKFDLIWSKPKLCNPKKIWFLTAMDTATPKRFDLLGASLSYHSVFNLWSSYK